MISKTKTGNNRQAKKWVNKTTKYADLKERLKVTIRTTESIEEYAKMSKSLYNPLPGAEEVIYKRISDVTISMKSCDYLKLPECMINEVPVTMDEKKDTVIIHHIIAKGTIDEQVMMTLRKKEKIQDALIDAVRVNLEVR